MKTTAEPRLKAAPVLLALLIAAFLPVTARAQDASVDIGVRSKVIDKKESSKPDRGVVTFKRECVRHDGKVVQEMQATLLYRRRRA